MLITLTTDFGLRDPFVGLMKGVILSIAPGCDIVDLSHEVPPQDVMAGGLVLESAIDVFPPQTIHVVVVNPGVGSNRRAIALQTDRGILVGPDNGLFSAALARAPMRSGVQLTNAKYHRHPVSATFHGRDVFAPGAAHLASGTPLAELGEPIDGPILLPLPHPVECDGGLELHVVSMDWFGNLITDLTWTDYAQWKRDAPDSAATILLGTTRIAGIRRTFADAEVGRPVAYFGSLNRLEIGVRNGSAAANFGASVGSVIKLTTSVY